MCTSTAAGFAARLMALEPIGAGMRSAGIVTALILALAWCGSITLAFSQGVEPASVVILGVSHSAMLVSESASPAVLRAFIGRVKPDAICIERPPEQFARNSHYEFTYEIQQIAVPYAREHDMALCPFDWMPSVDDQMLA